jgi:phospholipase C
VREQEAAIRFPQRLWNYAQDFAISDNFFNPTFGLSTPAGLNLIAGQTHSAVAGGTGDLGEDVVADTVIGDPQPSFNDCSTRETMQMTGRNVGDLLTEQGIT